MEEPVGGHFLDDLPKRVSIRDVPISPRIVPVKRRRKFSLSIVQPSIRWMLFKKDWANLVQGKSLPAKRFKLAILKLVADHLLNLPLNLEEMDRSAFTSPSH